jgi:hypothetical protein
MITIPTAPAPPTTPRTALDFAKELVIILGLTALIIGVLIVLKDFLPPIF